MRLVIISDTHNRRVALPPGDILIHCGDCTGRGTMDEFDRFLRWFRAQPHPHKVLVAGNHDFCLEGAADVPGVTYLRDAEADVAGLRIYGSPWTPTFYKWAFMLDRGPQIAERWALVPEGLDLLVTHGPPHGTLDHVPGAGRQGCEELAKAVERAKPKVHAFGHIHEGYGRVCRGGTEFINAAICDDEYEPVNAPTVVEVSPASAE